MDTKLFEEGKTSYSIVDEHGEKSTITIDKWEADLLQERLPDVRQWMQQTYNRACEKYSLSSRREKGNVVRRHAHWEAAKHPKYKDFMSSL